MFMSGSVRTADDRKVLTVDFSVALVEKEAAAGSPPANSPAP